MNNRPILSICIPTFNRSAELIPLVDEILKSPSSNFELVVVDNISSDGTQEMISSRVDSRLRYIRNEKNLGGPLNHLKAISSGKGVFNMLCLDKDRIDSDKLPHILLFLSSLDTEVSFGHFVLNSQETLPVCRYFGKFESILNASLKSAHPSGMFYRSDNIAKSVFLVEVFESGKSFPFFPDILNAEMAKWGDAIIVREPFVYTEVIETAAIIKSFTYNRQNLFFFPEQRFIELKTYVNAFHLLDIDTHECQILLTSLFMRTLKNCTLGYKYAMSDSLICAHYGIEARDIKLPILIKEYFILIYRFFAVNNIPFPFKWKSFWKSHFHFIYRIVRKYPPLV